MRLELQMSLLKPQIDTDYRRIVISYLKFALEHCEEGRFFENFIKKGIILTKIILFLQSFINLNLRKKKSILIKTK